MSDEASVTESVSKPTKSQPTGGMKDTIEQILIAFVLAFVFRAFVVEAFVIPTGSMAPTLLGAHMRFKCPDCGYGFTVGYNGGGEDVNIPSSAGKLSQAVYCPNCGFQMDQSQTEDPGVYFGDRILVLKYAYLFNEPKRWDVVVFKSPVNPDKYNYGQNYIKRLIGKPNESVMVLDGDVYIRPPGSDKFVVQTKPKYVQDELWRVAYDNDYRPQKSLDRGEVPAFMLPWSTNTGSGWELNDQVSHGRVFEFNGSTAGKISFEPGANTTAQTLSDYLVYDMSAQWRSPRREYLSGNDVAVSDLDLRLNYQRKSGDGPLTLALTKREHRFEAVFTNNQVELFDQTNNQRKRIGSPAALPSSSKPLQIEFSNADYQVTLRVNGEIAIQTTPADYSPNLANLLMEFKEGLRKPAPQIDISAENQSASLSHISVRRDAYYYNDRNGVRWATPRDFPEHVQVLGPDEYFVMGDNSLLSYDARCWSAPDAPEINLPDENLYAGPGRVPGRFMLGKAFFVYWPAGFKPNNALPAIVPDFGDMRVIH